MCEVKEVFSARAQQVERDIEVRGGSLSSVPDQSTERLYLLTSFVTHRDMGTTKGGRETILVSGQLTPGVNLRPMNFRG